MSLADESDFARVVLYGEPGSGKTTSAGHLAHVGPTVFFEAEPGVKKVAFKRRGIPLENIKPVRTVTSEIMMDSFWKLKAKLDSDPSAYAGAVLDTLTNFVSREVSAIRLREYNKAVEAADAAGEVYDGPKKTWTSRDHFGEMTGDVREVIEHYVDLPMHLVFTAHVRRDEDTDSGLVTYGPAATPAVQSAVVSYFDCVIRTERVGGFFVGHTRSETQDSYEAKDRLDVLPAPVMNLPTMDRIVAYVNGDLSEENDPIQQEWLAANDGNAHVFKKKGK